jgi:hypothetical protein
MRTGTHTLYGLWHKEIMSNVLYAWARQGFGMLHRKRQIHVENLTRHIWKRSTKLRSLVTQTTTDIDEQYTVSGEHWIVRVEILQDRVFLDPGCLVLPTCSHVYVEICKIFRMRHHPFEAVLFRVAGFLEDRIVGVVRVLVAMALEPGGEFLIDGATCVEAELTQYICQEMVVGNDELVLDRGCISWSRQGVRDVGSLKLVQASFFDHSITCQTSQNSG